MSEKRGNKIPFSKETGGSVLFLVLILIYLLMGYVSDYIPFPNEACSLLFTQGMILIPAVIYICMVDKKPLEFVRVKKFNIWSALLIIPLMITLLPVMALLNAFSMLFSTNVISSSVEDITGGSVWIGLLFVALLPAVVEEVTFRGAIYRSLRGAHPVRAIVLSGFIFGAMHMNFNQFVYAAALGIIMGFLVEATGSILSSMLLHFCFNANSVILMSLLPKMMEILSKFSAEPIPEQVQQSVNYTPAELLPMITMLLPVALISACFAVALYLLIAMLNGRLNYIKFLFAKSTKPQRDALPKPPIVNGFTIAAFVICFVFCVYRELVVRGIIG